MPRAGTESCSWCGTEVEEADGFRAYEPAGDRRAVFCRLEHVVPWAIQGPHWEAGALTEPAQAAADGPQQTCAHCGSELGEIQVLLIRHRGEHRIPDHFCSAEHMADWAKSGGRWQQPSS
jgi:hypothetical protein